jgi:hypothetical protein
MRLMLERWVFACSFQSKNLQPSFALEFHFAENPYFEDKVLSKTYFLEEDETFGDIMFDRVEAYVSICEMSMTRAQHCHCMESWKESYSQVGDQTTKVEARKRRSSRRTRWRCQESTTGLLPFNFAKNMLANQDRYGWRTVQFIL